MVSRLQAAQGCREASGLFLEHWVPFSWTPGSPQVGCLVADGEPTSPGTSTADSAAPGADEPVRPGNPGSPHLFGTTRPAWRGPLGTGSDDRSIDHKM